MKRITPYISIVFLLTCSTIIYEITLSRLFSYMLRYHFVLIIIAFSILGLGIGQIAYPKYFKSIDKSLTSWTAFPAVSMLLSFILMLILPKVGLVSTLNFGLLAFVLISIIPFIAIGIIYAQLFEAYKLQVSLLYAVDLIGAATGALLSVFLLNALSLGSVVAIAVLLLLLAFVLHTAFQKLRFSKLIIAAFIAMLPIVWLSIDKLNLDIPIVNDSSKDMLRLTNNPAVKSEILESRWNAFGKTDLIKLSLPDSTESMVMFIDGAAGTNVVNIDELILDTAKMRRVLGMFPALFAIDLAEEEEKDTVLIIGPGGGVDISAAYLTGYEFIEAVEVNPSFVELMEKYNRPTFSDKDNIKVRVKEGRNFVRNNKGKYDAILLTIPVTKSARGTDFYGLTENYLFTVEALADYLDGLTAEGAIYFTMHSKKEVYRMLANYLELQQQGGVNQEDAFKRIYIISNGMNPVLVIKKKPFDIKTIENLHLAAHYLRLDEDVFFFPYVEQVAIDTIEQIVNDDWYMFDKLLYDISTGDISQNKLWEASLLNLKPVTDDSPYFFNYNQGIPDSMAIPMLLGVVIIVWFLFNWFKGWKLASFDDSNQADLREKFGVLTFLVFLLGFSYFFIQAYLFQVLNLKLSSPSQSFSLLLFTFLLGNGLGSLFTRGFKKNLSGKLIIYTAAIVVVNLLTVYVLLPLWYPSLSEMGIAILLLLPSFFIGIPFPLLLKMAVGFKGKNAIPVLLGISSVAGVAASIFAIVISILYGYRLVFLLGLIGYSLLIMMGYRLKSLKSSKMNL
ncbi:MAG: hypothetical protein WD431_03760 [Cyclobacteriaceae bacterium]